MTARTYTLDVPDVGQFAFRRRTLGDECRIMAEADRLVGVDGTDSVRAWNLAYLLASLSVLTEQAPSGWDPRNTDPGDADSYSRVLAVWSAMQAAEERFRHRPGAGSPGAGEDPGAVG